ncbi:hypothetical protein EES46_26905 [Streptomyces sp. ADI98-10]|nr:hypothetical protein EES46_26905 [Streptomyces sp. ADI98-10]
MERNAVRGCGAGREGDDGAEGSPAQEVGADAAAGAPGGGGRRHQQDGGAAVAQPGQGVLDPGQFGLDAGGEAVLPARVVSQFVVAPVAVVEGRVAEHGVGREPGERVGPQGVPGPHGQGGRGAVRSAGAQGEAQCGEGGEPGVGLLGVQRRWSCDGAEQGAGPGRRIEDAAERPVGGRATGVLRGFGEVRHQLGEVRRGQGVLARVGIQVPTEQELEGLTGTDPGGELRGGAQERHGGQQGLRGGGANGSRPVNSRSLGRVRRVNHRGPGRGRSRRGRAGRRRSRRGRGERGRVGRGQAGRGRAGRGRAGRGRVDGSRCADGSWGCGPAGARDA